MSSSTTYEIHLGFWTNWSHGKVQGATVTMTRQNGGFLIAFLAIFIGMVGKSFWRLGCFSLHRYFSSSIAQDGLYHQRQTILRNSDTAQDGAWRLLMSMLAWRSGSRAKRPIRRLLPTIIAAFVISSAFGVASIFSSNVTSDTLNQVLLKGTRCGYFGSGDSSAATLYKRLTLLLPYNAQSGIKFLNYGTQCYTNESHTDGCNLYIKPRLPLVSTRGIPCPFGDNICKLENDNLMMDTGYLDSLDDLGINTAPQDRFEMRWVQKCAPLKTEGYTQDHNESEFGAIRRYMYGEVSNIHTVLNWSYQVPLSFTFLPGDNSSSANIPRLDYQLGVLTHYSTPNETLLPGVNSWNPIPALHLDDADVHVALLSAPQIHYAEQVNDPWFAAHTNASDIYYETTKSAFRAYLQDEPLGVMACTHQVQYCNPNSPGGRQCEPLRGIEDPRATENVKKVFTVDSQFDTLAWADSMWTGSVYTITAIVGFIGASALRARDSLSYGYSGGLPDDQFQLEAEHWAKGGLASLQDIFVTAANGIPENLYAFRVAPTENQTAAKTMCTNQKIVSANYSSFNVLGLALILILGIIIILLDMSLEPTVAWWQRRKYQHRLKLDEYAYNETEKHPLYGAIEWSQTNMLQLQRMAHEGVRAGEWSNCDQDIPVTEPGQFLSALDLRNLKHPQLQLQGETPGSEWSSIKPPNSWAMRRNDTGFDTLVEEAQSAKKEKFDFDLKSLPASPVVREAGHNKGLGVEMEIRPVEEEPPLADVGETRPHGKS